MVGRMSGSVIIWEKPRMAFSGVRSSWLMLARNSDLARLAFSACCLAAASASMLSANSRFAFSRSSVRADSLLQGVARVLAGQVGVLELGNFLLQHFFDLAAAQQAELVDRRAVV